MIKKFETYKKKRIIWRVPFQDPYLKLYYDKIGFKENVTPDTVSHRLKDMDWIYIADERLDGESLLLERDPWYYTFWKKRSWDRVEDVKVSKEEKDAYKFGL